MKRILLLFLLVPLFFGEAYAEETNALALEIFEGERLTQGLSKEEVEISGEFRSQGIDVSSALSRLWRAFLEHLKKELHAGIGFAATIIGLAFLSGLAGAICQEERIRGMIEICSVCAVAALLTGSMNSLISETVEAIYRLSDYSKAALPVVFTAAAASGAAGSAAAGFATASLALDILMSLSQRAIIPLIHLYLALTLSNAVFPNPILKAAEALSKWAAKTALTAFTAAFTAVLRISSFIGSSADAAAIKTTRSVISASLPVVGGMLSDASAAVLAAASVVRSCAGAFGLVAVSAMCVGPLALLLVKSFLFKTVAAVAESIQNPRLCQLLSGVGNAVGLLMGLFGCCAIMLFLSFGVAMKAVAQ